MYVLLTQILFCKYLRFECVVCQSLIVLCAGGVGMQQPTLSDMTQYELNFSLLVEQMLSKITDPAYRQMIVEVHSSIQLLQCKLEN